jgi:hypothetical protein
LAAFAEDGVDSDEFKSDGLHEKHAVATWEPSQLLAFAWRDGGKPRKPMSRWPVVGSSGYVLTSREQCGNCGTQRSLEAA